MIDIVTQEVKKVNIVFFGLFGGRLEIFGQNRYNEAQAFNQLNKEIVCMAQPKKQSSPRKTGLRRSHLVVKLARRVNGTSLVKAKTTKRETGKNIK